MARKTATVIIEGDPEKNRDANKMFVITEMSATAADWWATRVFLAIGRTGVDISEELLRSGIAGVATMGFKAIFSLPPHEVKPLLDEITDCVQVVPDPARPKVARSLILSGIGPDIEEVSTFQTLRMEWWKLHTGFSIPGLLSRLISGLGTLASFVTRTLAEPSAPSSAAESPPLQN
jgi:hypothetical protein